MTSAGLPLELPAPRPLRWVAIVWGVGGVLALLGQAIARLAPLARDAIERHTLSDAQLVALVTWVLFSAYTEGYKGFHKRFSPRVVARALHLARHPRALHVALAPAFCMSWFHASRRGLAVAWGIVFMVAGFVLLLRRVPQPWRGIVDAGVVVGLALGALSVLYWALCAARGAPVGIDPDLPAPRRSTDAAAGA
ncbi:MAG: hypothetical protein IT376_08750 [Polyangiaceae bacterium]|nr:hypothetical protein [Polyangiaceae bacterium]